MATSENSMSSSKSIDAILQPPTFLQQCVSMRDVLMEKKTAHFEIWGINDEMTHPKVKLLYQEIVQRGRCKGK